MTATPRPSRQPRPPTVTDRVVDLAVRGAVGAALALPYERRVVMFGRLLRHGLGPLARYRRRALENLALVRPDWPLARRQAIASEAIENFGRTVIENYSWRELGERLAQTPLTGGGLPHLEQARAERRPVIFVTGHFGNHEVPRQVLHRLGFEVGGLYRRMRNPLVNRHYAQTMENLSGPAFAQGRRGNLGFVRYVEAGGMATILFDLHVVGGVPIRFLGKPALTPLTPAELAVKYDALLVPYWGIRHPDGLTFDAVVEEPISHEHPLAMMEEATRRLEARIEAHPGQWFWVHRRWKAG